MNWSFGIFDVFASAIPGSLYLLVTLYVSLRFGWVDLDDLAALNTTLAVTGGVLTSYLAGHLAAAPLQRLSGRLPLWRPTVDRARREFVRRNPTLADRRFLEADPHTLLAGIRQASPEAALVVDRSRATGLLLRNIAPALMLGVIVALGEAALGGRLSAVAAAGGLLLASGLALRESQKFGHWAVISTFEQAAWLPDVEARLGLERPSPDSDG